MPLVEQGWLAGQLAGGLWCQVTTIAQTGSTNADLAALAREGAPSGTVVIADHQTQGRGRFTRPWQAPPRSSVAMSLLLRPERAEVRRWLWLPLVTGLAVADALR
ncbi:MAG: biotin--[acetyl-CoA-carboxylase] ligase, partial [Propionicimonas sp.]